jgi:hypothetical protein
MRGLYAMLGGPPLGGMGADIGTLCTNYDTTHQHCLFISPCFTLPVDSCRQRQVVEQPFEACQARTVDSGIVDDIHKHNQEMDNH